MNPIDHTQQQLPEVGNVFSWLKKAAHNVNDTIQDVKPVIDHARGTFGNNNDYYGSRTGVVNPYGNRSLRPVYQMAPQQQQSNNNNNNNNNKTILYIGIAAAVVVAIILLNKK